MKAAVHKEDSMPTADLPTRRELFEIPDWKTLKSRYSKLHFIDDPYEAVEAYGVTQHKLDEKLPHLQEFWRYHIAPATLRPKHTHFAPQVRQVTSRMAERSYEIYCNISDAFDELTVIANNGTHAPRYRACLNVLRCVGDAILLLDELVNVIGIRHESKTRRETSERATLARILGVDIVLFPNWKDKWEKKREAAIAYRNMLVHHGRPWLHFTGKEFVGFPYVLKIDHCKYEGSKYENPDEFKTWAEQIELFKKHKDRFITLPEACRTTCDLAVAFLDDAYANILSHLDAVLSDTDRFAKYRKQWGTKDYPD
jgi:hypothetical protein